MRVPVESVVPLLRGVPDESLEFGPRNADASPEAHAGKLATMHELIGERARDAQAPGGLGHRDRIRTLGTAHPSSWTRWTSHRHQGPPSPWVGHPQLQVAVRSGHAVNLM